MQLNVLPDLETLIKKHAAFLVSHQQHRDPAKWYNGLFSDWDMKNHVLRGPDNLDGLPATQFSFHHRRSACDLPQTMGGEWHGGIAARRAPAAQTVSNSCLASISPASACISSPATGPGRKRANSPA